MLSTVLKSDIAVDVSIKIMDTFVRMRNFFVSNKDMFARLDRVELKKLETDKKLEEVFNYIASNTEVKQKIFFDGQIYDAFSFIADLIEKAQKKLILIDNYVGLFSAGFTKILLNTNLKNLRAQHTCESLGFQKMRINHDSWRDQLGEWQSSVDYELTPQSFQEHNTNRKS